MLCALVVAFSVHGMDSLQLSQRPSDLANSSALLSEVTRKLVGWEAELKKVLDTSEGT